MVVYVRTSEWEHVEGSGCHQEATSLRNTNNEADKSSMAHISSTHTHTWGGGRLEEGSHRTRNTSFLPLLLCLVPQRSYGLHNHVTELMINCACPEQTSVSLLLTCENVFFYRGLGLMNFSRLC